MALLTRPAANPGWATYSSKIIKASALLDDAKTLLSHWDATASVPDNLDRIRRENVLGKASRSRVEDILAVFRQRYLVEPDVVRALVVLVKNRFPAASLDRVLYFHAARADALLHDAVTEILMPMQAQGIADIDPVAVQRVLAKWVEKGLTATAWSENTTVRVAQGLLSTLRDFGVLQGAVNKRIAPTYMPVTASSPIRTACGTSSPTQWRKAPACFGACRGMRRRSARR
jgi:BrxA